ncbi:MAG: ATP-binding protein, partial [Nannocystaceae bacterium]
RYEGALERCETDVTKLRQVLINLIGNASKFTRAGTIEVAAQRIEIRGEGWVEIAISDTGIGIPADKLERIFHPFTQADNSTTRQYGGTGLGLTICKKICVMLGGTIMVESEVGVGSTFTIVLPAGV